MNHSRSADNNVAALTRLLELYDEEFVTQAYREIFRREPDPGGMANYLAQVRRGVPKAQIILELAESPEGIHAGPDLSTIRNLFARYRERRPTILNRLYQSLARTTMAQTARQSRIIDNRLYLLERAIAHQDKQLSDILSLVQQLKSGVIKPSSVFQPSEGNDGQQAVNLSHLAPNIRDTFLKLKGAVAVKRGN